MLVGDLNESIADPQGKRRYEEITADLSDVGLEDMSKNSLLIRTSWSQDSQTRIMLIQGRVVRSQMEYILGKNRRLLYNVSIQDPRHNTEHYMVLGCLHDAAQR